MSNIIIEKLCKSYGEHKVLEDFGWELEANKVNALMAASGVGKTTLLRILAGLEESDSGEIIGLEGKRLSVVFQEDRLCTQLSAYGNIRFVTEASEANIRDGLVKIGLAGFEDVPINQLSGGMKRRVSILRALLTEYDVLLLDEPFKGLDKETKEQVIAYMRGMIEGKTVLFITHQEEEAAGFGAEIRYMCKRYQAIIRREVTA